jgi:hypothetical protein
VALAGLAHALTEDRQAAGCDLILKHAPREFQHEIADPVALRRMLGDLCREDWLERVRDAWRFRVDLFRLWMRQEHSIWQVADELRRSTTA